MRQNPPEPDFTFSVLLSLIAMLVFLLAMNVLDLRAGF
jgi:hypothetical protein